MTTPLSDADLASMPVARRLELFQQLWDSLHPQALATPLSPEQTAEVRRRVEMIDAGRLPCHPWDQVRQRLLRRK